MKDAISWFEIGTRDLQRAQRFYEQIFQFKMGAMDLPKIQMRLFPIADPSQGVGGALVYSERFHQVSDTLGPLVYLNANPDLQSVLDRVESAGGEILVGKTPVSNDFGYIGVIRDSEGNRVGLHSLK